MIEPCYITGEMSPDFEEAVRLGAEAGIRTVQLRQNIWGRNIEQLTDEDVSRAKSVLTAYGVRVGSLYSPFGKCNIEDPVEIKHHMAILSRVIELAHAFETRLVRVFPFRRPGYKEYESSHLDEYFSMIIEKLTPAVKMAEAEDIVLCFEVVGSTLAMNAWEIRRIVDALGPSPAISLVWEINVGWLRGELPSEGYPYVKGKVRDVHVKANPQQNIDPVGSSTETYEDAFRRLLADGYDGFATIEHWPGAEGTLRGIRQLQAILERVSA